MRMAMLSPTRQARRGEFLREMHQQSNSHWLAECLYWWLHDFRMMLGCAGLVPCSHVLTEKCSSNGMKCLLSSWFIGTWLGVVPGTNPRKDEPEITRIWRYLQSHHNSPLKLTFSSLCSFNSWSPVTSCADEKRAVAYYRWLFATTGGRSFRQTDDTNWRDWTKTNTFWREFDDIQILSLMVFGDFCAAAIFAKSTASPLTWRLEMKVPLTWPKRLNMVEVTSCTPWMWVAHPGCRVNQWKSGGYLVCPNGPTCLLAGVIPAPLKSCSFTKRRGLLSWPPRWQPHRRFRHHSTQQGDRLGWT